MQSVVRLQFSELLNETEKLGQICQYQTHFDGVIIGNIRNRHVSAQ